MKVYPYSQIVFNHHVVAFFEASALKETCVFFHSDNTMLIQKFQNQDFIFQKASSQIFVTYVTVVTAPVFCLFFIFFSCFSSYFSGIMFFSVRCFDRLVL